MFDGFGGYGGGWGYVAMVIGMLVFWGLLIGGVVLLNRPGRRNGVPSEASTPEDLLAERFARGEIDEREYTGKRAVLHDRVLP